MKVLEFLDTFYSLALDDLSPSFLAKSTERDQEIAAKLPENWRIAPSAHKHIFRGFSHQETKLLI